MAPGTRAMTVTATDGGGLGPTMSGPVSALQAPFSMTRFLFEQQKKEPASLMEDGGSRRFGAKGFETIIEPNRQVLVTVSRFNSPRGWMWIEGKPRPEARGPRPEGGMFEKARWKGVGGTWPTGPKGRRWRGGLLLLRVLRVALRDALRDAVMRHSTWVL